ncbi:DegT/DnrJ/EryC1/StrS family aminotransferase, partial [Candidatus Pelagibacter sp.]|nr:DegT/DnrJ/EryC1/StrS family aminotransferase [Candidatus Pelagibacter sp.]
MNKLVPRQIIYQKKIFYLYFKSFFPKKIDSIILNKLKNKLNVERIFKIFTVPKARIGLYLCVKYILKDVEKKKVIMSPYTIFDMVNKVIQAGGQPVFIDNESKYSLNLNIKDLKKKIDNKTAALIITHHSLNQNNFNEILKICKQNNIKLIQDLAISFNSKYKNKNIYNYGDFSICSFNLFKFVSSIFGGLIITKDKNFAKFYDKQINKEKVYNFVTLRKYFFKGLKFKILTNSFLFKYFFFWIVKFGSLLKIRIIINALQNDPKPFFQKYFDNKELISMNKSQLDLVINQIDSSNQKREIREKNYNSYLNKIK